MGSQAGGDFVKALLKVLRAFFDRLADWYWRDPIARKRHELEEQVRQYGGTVTWGDQ